MDEELLKGVERVRTYCNRLMSLNTSLATGVDICAMMRKQVAMEVLLLLGDSITNYEEHTPLNSTSGNNERELNC